MIANNKKLLAVVIGTLIAGAATTAVANESKGPTFYGNLNVSLDYIDAEGAKTGGPSFPSATATTDHFKVSSHNSRIGFTHELPLDNGLKALIKAEVKLNADSTTSPFESREIYVGAKGDFGQVIGGRINRPLRTVEGRIDQFNHLYGDINTVIGGEGFSDNVIQYSTPKFGNGSAKIAYIAAENKQHDKSADTKDGVSASVTYDDGKLYAALGYEYSVPNVGATNIDLGNPTSKSVKTETVGTVTVNTVESKTTISNANRVRLGLQYNLGALTLGTIIQHQEETDNSTKSDFAYVVNGAYVINKVKVKAQYGHVEGNSDNSREFVAVGADYSLGKGSYTYLTYTQINKDLVKAGSGFASGVGKYTDNVVQIGFNQAF